MSKTQVLLDDDKWTHVLDTLEDSDDEALVDCRDAIATQVRSEHDSLDTDEQQSTLGADKQQNTLDTDTAFELLADPVRRELLWTCRERDEIRVDDLVDDVAGEVDSDPEKLSIDLHHTHLPKLDNAGVVTVESDTVQYGGDQLLDCLVAVDRE